jgi:hypothetical protein
VIAFAADMMGVLSGGTSFVPRCVLRG